MIKAQEFYRTENEKILDCYERSLVFVRDMASETKGNEGEQEKERYYKFFNQTAKWVLGAAEIERNCNEECFNKKSFNELKEENSSLYSELLGESYNTSYANPTYCVSIFGDEMGQLLSAFYAMFREYIGYAFKHRLFNMLEINKLLIDAYHLVKYEEVDYEELKRIVTKTDEASIIRNISYRFEERLNKDFGLYKEIIMEEDLNDPRYLFRYGKYITENEVKTSEFLLKYPTDKIKKLSSTVVEAFIRSFTVDNKDRKNRNVVRLMYNAGQEILVRQVIRDFKQKGFEVSIAEVLSTNPNKQYDYDHRFDNALYLNEEYSSLYERSFEKACEISNNTLKLSAGIILFESFGEKPFSPVKKSESLKLSKEQEKIHQKQRNMTNLIYEKYEVSEEISFCIIAFPSPEIGDKFEEIFEDILKINMMDNGVYEKIQQHIIDALDLGEFVHIKGKGENQTDIKVKLQKLQNPSKQTNFINCVADVNIPLGEVYTTPELKRTSGVLHIEDIFLGGLRYKNLKVMFKDGYVSDYSCTNFDNEIDNREYIKENLMRLHETLPLGEFAIGTNTYAYVVAQKYGIIEVLPILIIEKMGPHFAIGDTCFSWTEDLPVYNILNKKEITARDNEMSLLRKEDINKAYTGVHTDITLPYEGIESISVITYSGERIEIIRDGKFALKGTEELNKPFE